MKIKSITEEILIKEIRKDFLTSKSGLELGIGDDAAVIKSGKKNYILTKDLVLEKIHFDKEWHPPFFLGRKSINVNLSDIAAMGGRPMYALLGLGLPEKTDAKWVEEFMSGIQSACREFDVVLAGGDVSQARSLTISVTVIGEGKPIIKRSGAKPGDLIYVSGKLGDSSLGLELIKQGTELGENSEKDMFLHAFLNPFPQVNLGGAVSKNKMASSMIDVSDGLSVDLNHICEESGVGAEIFVEKIPYSKEMSRFHDDVMQFCLHGGEDYCLLFTVPRNKKDKINSLKREYPLTEIGKIVSEKNIYLIGEAGKKQKLQVKGFQHFTDQIEK